MMLVPDLANFHAAVKSNPDLQVLQLLGQLGTGFDCASKTEIDAVLSLGIEPGRIIYAQPCKTISYLRHASDRGVSKMTFDNLDELHKIKKWFPDAELFLRISCDDSDALVKLSMKFGASMSSVPGLLKLAAELQLNVVGVSFHIGSLASDPTAFERAVLDARSVFELALNYGHVMHTLDVGGGFSDDLFEEMAGVLGKALDDHFPSNISIIAEPGRYYVATAFTLACNVIARRTIDDESDPAKKSYMLYLNDGLYGNFSSIMFDHQHPVAKILSVNNQMIYDTDLAEDTKEGIQYTIFGPTCDGIDVISESIKFRQILDIGDWMYFENMGAYTKCSATRFNGFSDAHDVVYVVSEPGARALLGML